VKFVFVVAEPPPLVTVIRPVVAPLGTVATMVPVDLSTNVAVVPLNDTLVVPMK